MDFTQEDLVNLKKYEHLVADRRHQIWKEKRIAKRRKMNRRKSKRSFSKHAAKTHRKNLPGPNMRGGIRL